MMFYLTVKKEQKSVAFQWVSHTKAERAKYNMVLKENELATVWAAGELGEEGANYGNVIFF